MTSVRATHTVRTATAEERGVLVDVLVEAFDRDPLGQWLYPDPVERRAQHARLFGRVLSEPRPGAVVDTIDDLDAFAIWHPPADTGPTDPVGPAATPGDRLFAAVADAAPRYPNWNLAFIGVRVGGTGAGGSLMRHGLTQVRRSVALWTGNEANLAFYRKFGFEMFAHGQVEGAGFWWLGPSGGRVLCRGSPRRAVPRPQPEAGL